MVSTRDAVLIRLPTRYINQQVNYASYGFNSGVTLFNGFAIQHDIRQNNLIFQAAKMEWQQAKDNLTINIILAYLQVLNNEDLAGAITEPV